MDIGPRERKALNIGQLLTYLRSMGVDEPESVPIYFSDELPAILAAYDAAQGVLILSDLDGAPLQGRVGAARGGSRARAGRINRMGSAFEHEDLKKACGR